MDNLIELIKMRIRYNERCLDTIEGNKELEDYYIGTINESNYLLGLIQKAYAKMQK